MIDIELLRASDAGNLDSVADGVFDNTLRPDSVEEFLHDPRHHLAVAVADGVVVGMASAVHYVHPDKPRELWVNEVGVAESHQRQGLATRLIEALLSVGRELGCTAAWVLTDRSNEPAMALYSSLGGVPDTGDTVMVSFDLGAHEDDGPTS